MEKPKRELYVETLRGLAILLLLSYHSMRTVLPVKESLWFTSLEYFRMPLFSVISGYVYSLRPVDVGRRGEFVSGKARRLLIPAFVCLSLKLLIEALGVMPAATLGATVAGGTPLILPLTWRAVVGYYLYEPVTYWFVEAIFTVFMVVVVLESFRLLSTFRGWCLSLAAAVIINVTAPAIRPFSLEGAFWLLPYFTLGIGLQRYHHRLVQKKVVPFLAAIALAGLALQHLSYFHVLALNTSKTSSLLAVLAGGSGVWLLFFLKPESRLLARLGNSAYTIYLYHRLAFVGCAYVLSSLVVKNTLLQCVAYVCFGALLPIGVERLCSRSVLLSRILLGELRGPRRPAVIVLEAGAAHPTLVLAKANEPSEFRPR